MEPALADALLAATVATPVVSSVDAEHRSRANEAAVKRDEAAARIVQTAADQAESDRKLRSKVSNRVFWAIIAQVLVADVGMFVYADHRHWEIAAGVVSSWLGATVIQVIAVALVIAKSLFPEGGVNPTLATEALHQEMQKPGAAKKPATPPGS
jgi:hypothetical protein